MLTMTHLANSHLSRKYFANSLACLHYFGLNNAVVFQLAEASCKGRRAQGGSFLTGVRETSEIFPFIPDFPSAQGENHPPVSLELGGRFMPPLISNMCGPTPGLLENVAGVAGGLLSPPLSRNGVERFSAGEGMERSSSRPPPHRSEESLEGSGHRRWRRAARPKRRR